MRVDHEMLAREFQRAKGDRNRLQRWWMVCSAFLQAQDGIVSQLRDLVRKFIDLIPANVENASPDTWVEWFKRMRRDQERYLFLREHWVRLVTDTSVNERGVMHLDRVEVVPEQKFPFDVESIDRAIDKHLKVPDETTANDAGGAEVGTGNAAQTPQGDQPQALPANDGAEATA